MDDIRIAHIDIIYGFKQVGTLSAHDHHKHCLLLESTKTGGGGEVEERGKEDTERSQKLPITQRITYYTRIQCGCDEISHRYQR